MKTETERKNDEEEKRNDIGKKIIEKIFDVKSRQ